MAILRSGRGKSSPRNSPSPLQSSVPTSPSHTPSPAAKTAPAPLPRRSSRIKALSTGQRPAEVSTPRKRPRSPPVSSFPDESGKLGLRSRSVRRNVDFEGKVEAKRDGGKSGETSSGEAKRNGVVDVGDEMVVEMEEDVGVQDGGGESRKISADEKGKGKLVVQDDLGSMKEREIAVTSDRALQLGPKIACSEQDGGGESTRLSADEKGKGKLVVEDDLGSMKEREIAVNPDRALQLGPKIASSELNKEEGHEEEDNEDLENSEEYQKRVLEVERLSSRIMNRRAAHKEIARRVAKEFAYFHPKKEEGEVKDDEDDEDEDLGIEDEMKESWPRPLQGMIQDQEQTMLARTSTESSSKGRDDIGSTKINWKPSTVQSCAGSGNPAPSLMDLCLTVLCKNADAIESLEGVPDAIKTRLLSLLYGCRRMEYRIIRLILGNSPVEVHLSDCSWATEGQLEELLSECITGKLKVLQLDLCGRGLPDYVLHTTLARFPDSLQSLTGVSLKGAYRLSDEGLNVLVSAAPFLDSINLCHCSLLTSAGIIELGHKLEHQLRELYIDECQNVDAMLILPALKKLKVLEVLSVAGIPTVSNKFVRRLFSGSHSNIRELGFANCQRLTSASMKTIGENCLRLQVLDLQNLLRLTDSALVYLASGCQLLQKLKLRRTGFSDEAIAKLVDASGGSLTELSLNNVEKVAEDTALAIARRCPATLRSLDLSFCRKMSDQALGLIADSCFNLRRLKLFGCTQVTDEFLKGNSNLLMKVIGLEGPILDQMEMSNYI